MGAELALQPALSAAVACEAYTEVRNKDCLAATLCLPYWLSGSQGREPGEGEKILKYAEKFTTTLLGSQTELVLLTHCVIYKGRPPPPQKNGIIFWRAGPL